MSAQTAASENSASGVRPAAPWRVKVVSVLPNYRLAVTFQDELSGIIDCSRILETAEPGIFAPLASAEFFSQCRLELGVMTWPNGADLDPRWMHESVERQKTWSVPF